MHAPSLLLSSTVALSVFFSACQSTSTKNDTEAVHATYQPTSGTLRIVSDADNPEMASITLLNDKKADSLAAAIPQNGKFTLVVNQLPVQEVYFLEIKGTSTRSGTDGLDWTEYVPVYLEKSNAPLTLDYRFFDHPGSISKAKFSIQGGSDEQKLLNEWQEALNDQQADIEGKTVDYTFGGSMSAKEHGEHDATGQRMNVTQRFVQQKRPLATSLFLAYTTNDHRRYAADYSDLYDAVSDDARQTKYGIDLIHRLDRIMNPIQQLNPVSQVAAVDQGLNRLSWPDFATYKYLLLCFWNSMDKDAHADIKRVDAQATALKQQEMALIHLSVDSRFSQWKKMSPSLNLRHNYKLRNEVQQSLIDSLYLTELPRYLLIQPDGKVIDADVSTETLDKLLKQAE